VLVTTDYSCPEFVQERNTWGIRAPGILRSIVWKAAHQSGGRTVGCVRTPEEQYRITNWKAQNSVTFKDTRNTQIRLSLILIFLNVSSNSSISSSNSSSSRPSSGGSGSSSNVHYPKIDLGGPYIRSQEGGRSLLQMKKTSKSELLKITEYLTTK
jgi:hypothetical protein